MSLSRSQEMFKNMKDIPLWDPKKHSFDQKRDTRQFYENELHKINEGVTIGGYKIHPWLYFHLNFFKTPIPTLVKEGEKPRDILKNPPLDDNVLYIAETLFEAEEKNKVVFFFGTRGFTKALRNDEKLLYEDGSWRDIGFAAKGDRIFGADGEITTITNVSPQGVVDIYEVELIDGRKIKCCEDHLWTVYDMQAKLEKTLPLKEIIKRYKYNRKYTGNKYKNGEDRVAEVYNYYIPINKTVKFPEIPLPIDPYYLGLWLGDGTSDRADITTADKEISDFISIFAEKHGCRLQHEPDSYRAAILRKKGDSVNHVKRLLKDMGVLNNKHIPEVFFKASEEQRMELLRGILDTDGSASKAGNITFAQANEELCIQVRNLALSLGIKSLVKKGVSNYIKKDGELAEHWLTILFTGKDVFKLKRKKDRLKKDRKNVDFGRNYSSIVNITKVDPAEATCIRVDNNDKLFITTNYVVTHNSTFLASYCHRTILTTPDGIFSIIGGDDKDLSAITSMMSKSFTNINPAFYLPTLTKEWTDHIEFGIKDKASSGKTYKHNEILVTNAVSGTGKASEKGAGLNPIGYIMDEALHEDCVVYTETDERPIKDIKVGDKIFGRDGKLTTVLDKINPGIVKLYTVELADGRNIEASGNHLWTVFNTQLKRWEVKTTEDLFKRHTQKKKDLRYNKEVQTLIYSLPNNLPLNYPEKDLPIDPYWLGLWLGDGGKNGTTIYTVDDEIEKYCLEYAQKIGYNGVSKILERHSQNGKIFRTVSVTNKKGLQNKLREALREEGIFKNKFIPDKFLKASVEQRLELLRGLMDTDGSASSTAAAEFTTSIPELADSFEKLCRSLGITTKRSCKNTSYKKDGTSVQCTVTHRFNLKTELSIFKLKRKSQIFHKDIVTNKKQIALLSRISIKSVTDSGKKAQAFCLKVDNDDNLFVAGNYIVTHNCGKYKFLATFESAIPSFKTQYGYRTVPILSGTSGNTVLSKDAREVLENPDAYDVLPMNFDRLNRTVPPEYITWGDDLKKKFGTFVPGQMSYRLLTPRKKTNLASFLGIDSSDLRKMEMTVPDWENASKEIEQMGGDKAKQKTKNRNKMYYPRKLDDCFLTLSPNPFPVDIINKKIKELQDSGDYGKSVEIYRDENKFKYKFSQKDRAEVEFRGGVWDAPTVIFEEIPEERPEKYYFVGGLDDYKQNVSDTDSLGSLYVLKRRNLEIDTPCETIVACINTRPRMHRDFHADIEKVLEAWNAECLMEAADTSFEEFLDLKGKAYDYLAPAFTYAKSKRSRNSAANQERRFGLPATVGNNETRHNKLVDWTWEEHTIGMDKDGNPIIKHGVEFIDDIDLLMELRDWKKDKNCDRKEAFSHALLHAIRLDEQEIRPKSLRIKRNVLKSGADQSEVPEKKKKKTVISNNPYGRRRMNPYSTR